MDDQEATVPAISNEERRRRQDAVNFARANVGLEGFKTTPEEEERCRRFVAGEIDLVEFVGEPEAQHGKTRRGAG